MTSAAYCYGTSPESTPMFALCALFLVESASAHSLYCTDSCHFRHAGVWRTWLPPPGYAGMAWCAQIILTSLLVSGSAFGNVSRSVHAYLLDTQNTCMHGNMSSDSRVKLMMFGAPT